MNQHFNKQNIEAAIRVAFANPCTEIYVNGERSKKRYSVTYSKLFGEIDLHCGTDYKGCVYISSFPKTQKSIETLVHFVTDIFCDYINGNVKVIRKAA